MSDIDDFQGRIDNAKSSMECLRAYESAWQWAQDRIQSLEAPYKLVDTPPSEPGWYWMANDLDPAVVVHVRLIGSELCADKCPVSFYPKTHKWGSAPLPLPMESDDE